MLDARNTLSNEGICEVRDLFTADEVKEVSRALDPLFEARRAERRAYVNVDEMHALGLFPIVFKPALRDALRSAVPDPVLYHFHAYEIAGGDTRSHIFSESLSGWHRDPDSDHVPGDPTHVSLFLYLTDVGPDDGAFEFLPGDPTRIMTGSTPTISVRGPAGMTFMWHRSYYHRASPNRGPVRRRLLKISVQRNAYPSVHLRRESFVNLCAAIPPGDPETDLFLGRMQGRDAPVLPPATAPSLRLMEANGVVNVPTVDLVKAQVKGKIRSLRQVFRSGAGGRTQAVAAYD